MTYATLSDLTMQFGETEVNAIADRNRDGVADVMVVEGALQRASDVMDSYLAARYPLPLLVVPQLLVSICCNIARYELLGADATETEAARNRHKDALRMLEQIRNGRLDIGVSVSGQPAIEAPTVKIVSGGSVFNRVNLRDY